LAVETQGRLVEAERLCREVLAIRLKTLGPDHQDTLGTQLDLANLLRRQGDVTQAERMHRKALADESRVLGSEHPDTLRAQSGRAEILIQERRYIEAETIARPAYEAQFRILGATHSDTVDALRILGKSMAHLHRYDEAVKVFRDAMDAETASGKQGDRWAMWYAMACVAASADRTADAFGFLHQAVDSGYSDGDGLSGDDDLKRLRNDPRFQQIVAQIQKRHTAA
jgi:tetratricopeptide (TPR) repeat protein